MTDTIVASEADLHNAILAINQAAQVGSVLPKVILTADITLTHELPAIIAGNNSVTFVGGGHVIDGASTFGGPPGVFAPSYSTVPYGQGEDSSSGGNGFGGGEAGGNYYVVGFGGGRAHEVGYGGIWQDPPTAGGGGLGAGGAIFVQMGGNLIIAGGSTISGGFAQGGAGGAVYGDIPSPPEPYAGGGYG